MIIKGFILAAFIRLLIASGGYKVRLDLDSDEKLDVSGETLDNRRVAVWSDGPDRKAETKDDVKTW